MSETCANCRFGKAASVSVQCRRYPPPQIPYGSSGVQFYQERPFLAKDDWCGEYQPKAAKAGEGGG